MSKVLFVAGEGGWNSIFKKKKVIEGKKEEEGELSFYLQSTT